MPVGAIMKHLEEGGLVTNDDNGLFNLYSSMKKLEESAFSVDRKTLIDPKISDYYSNDFLRLEAAVREKCFNPGCGNETQSKGQICDNCEAVISYGCFNLCTRSSRVDRPSSRNGLYSNGGCPGVADLSTLHKCIDHFNRQSYGDDMKCPSCEMLVTNRGFVIKRKAVQISPEQKTKSSISGTGGLGFVEKNITFMVKEDLSIIKSSALSALALLQSMKSDFADLDTKEIDVGQKEGLLLVRAAMVSKTPLTDVFEPLFK